MKSADAKTIRTYFARTIGKTVDFTPDSNKSTTAYAGKEKANYWEALEFLDEVGTLRIEGHELKFWKDIRDSFLGGGQLMISSERIDSVLNELSFLTGKSFSVVSGDRSAKLNETVSGNGLEDFLGNLQKAANIKIIVR